jgi:hypothetical protein
MNYLRLGKQIYVVIDRLTSLKAATWKTASHKEENNIKMDLTEVGKDR